MTAETFILDTGPLFDFLLLRFSEEASRERLREDLEYLKTDLYRRHFKEFMMRQKPFLTTPGVIAEIQGLSRRLPSLTRVDEGSFWTLARKEFRELGIDEEIIRLGEMQEEDLANYGPVDASLLELARRKQGEHRRVAVLIGDERLWHRCQKQQIPVRWIHEILSGWVM